VSLRFRLKTTTQVWLDIFILDMLTCSSPKQIYRRIRM